MNQRVRKFKDKLKLQNAITLEKDKERNTFTFISDGPQSIDNEDGNINYYTDLTRNDPLVSQPIWSNKLFNI